MQEVSPHSPEERHKRLHKARASVNRGFRHMRPGSHAFEVTKRVAVGVYTDGFIHAGNLAYLALLTLFPFFIVAAAVAQLFGQSDETLHALDAFLRTVPPGVADVLRKPVTDVLSARSGTLLWLGALVGLWTTGSFIETIRDILRRAYGVKYSRPFWEYRLWSLLLIIGSVLLVLIAFAAQVVLIGVQEFIVRLLPVAQETASLISALRIAPGLALFAAMYLMFWSLTPKKYRLSKCPKWPGALAVTLWWLAVTALLPRVLGMLGGYDLTYGSLAGVMIALIFFFFIGLGVVFGAELNAALAETPDAGLEEAAMTEGASA